MLETGLTEGVIYIIDGFTSSFCQGIPQHSIKAMDWNTAPNHESARYLKLQIEASLAKWI